MINMTNNEYKSIRVKPSTHRIVKIETARRGQTQEEFINFLLKGLDELQTS